MTCRGASSSKRRVVVIGGGITGLTAAYDLTRDANVEVTLLEAQSRIGGNIATHRQDGFLIDAGPDSFVRTKPEATQLIRELGLGDELVTTASRRVFIVQDGRLVLMPAGMALAIPTRIGPMLTTPLLSVEGKLRMLGDLVLPAGFGRTTEREESIAAFVTRRFGAEAAEKIAGPLLGGIYAGDVDHLSIEATFPQLISVEQKHGSLIKGLFAAQQARHGQGPTRPGPRGWLDVLRWLQRDETESPSPFFSLRNGMGTLLDALVERLPPDTIRLGAAVTGLAHDAGRWHVRQAGSTITADAVVLAVPANVASRLVPNAALRSELAGIPYVSTATVFFAFDRDAVSHDLDGVGFIVPRGEGQIIAATWVSSKWEGRAPEGQVLMRAFVGGSRQDVDVEQTSEHHIVRVALDELRRLMGPLGDPRFTRVFKYVRTNSQPVVGHATRLERIGRLLAQLPGLYIANGAYEGVGIPDCVKQGRAAAAAALDRVTGNAFAN